MVGVASDGALWSGQTAASNPANMTTAANADGPCIDCRAAHHPQSRCGMRPIGLRAEADSSIEVVNIFPPDNALLPRLALDHSVTAVPPSSAPTPSLLTELNTADIPAVYRRFAEVVGEKHWRHRVGQIKAAIKGNRFLANHYHQENAIAFALERCGALIAHFGRLPDDPAATRDLYPAISFAGQVLSMMDLATPLEADRLRKRVEGALNKPDAMRGYLLELGTATHFARRGHKLQWPEMVGLGTFDLLVTDLAENGLEIECKSISEDKGRSIHRCEALVFHSLLLPELAAIRKSLKVGLSVVLTVPGRLPTQYADRVALAKRVTQQINMAHSATLDDGTTIRISEFDLTRVADVVKDHGTKIVRPVIESVTGTQNREGMLLGSDAGGALAFVVQSAVADDFLDATFDTLSDAAKRQLTRARPGILIAGFDGLNGEQLLSIAGQDRDANQPPTALSLKVSKFLSADHRNYVVGVGFLSRSALLPVTNGMVDSGGTAYYFPKSESPFWHDDLSGLFNWRARPT